jgi:hypothetical protein
LQVAEQQGDVVMPRISATFVMPLTIAVGLMSFAGAAPAAPVVNPLALKSAVPAVMDTVQWRGRGGGFRGGWRGGRGWGWGGAAAGAIIGGALASRYYSYPSPYYYEPYYGPPPGAYAPAYAGDDQVAYCMQRFKSYDPRSGTYVGFDGQRHPCP